MVAEDKDDLHAIIVEREGRIVSLIPGSGYGAKRGPIPTFWSNVSLKVAWWFVVMSIS